MKFSRSVDIGPRKRWFIFSDVADSRGTLNFHLPKPRGFDHNTTYVTALQYQRLYIYTLQL